SCSISQSSQMQRLGGRMPPVIVPAIEISDRRPDQLNPRGIVGGSQLDGNVIAADFRNVASAEGAHAAMPAKQMVRAVASELIVAQGCRTRDEPEGVRLDGDAPVAGLGADRAVAPAGAGRKIEIRFEADGPAV